QPNVIMLLFAEELFFDEGWSDFSGQKLVGLLDKVVTNQRADRHPIREVRDIIVIARQAQTDISLGRQKVIPLAKPLDVAVRCVLYTAGGILTISRVPSDQQLISGPVPFRVQ